MIGEILLIIDEQTTQITRVEALIDKYLYKVYPQVEMNSFFYGTTMVTQDFYYNAAGLMTLCGNESYSYNLDGNMNERKTPAESTAYAYKLKYCITGYIFRILFQFL